MHKLIVAVLLVAAVVVPTVALAASATADRPTGGNDHALELRAKQQRAHLKALRAHLRKVRAERRRRKRAERAAASAPSTASPALQAIASCESGGNPRAIGGGGAYRGKYQFDYATWASVGGSGDPAAAPEAEQDRRAAMLYARSGASSWPVCGQ